MEKKIIQKTIVKVWLFNLNFFLYFHKNKIDKIDNVQPAWPCTSNNAASKAADVVDVDGLFHAVDCDPQQFRPHSLFS